MQHRWLSLAVFSFLAVVVFILFAYRIQPLEPPESLLQPEITTISQPTISFVNPSIGAEDPQVTIVVFGDFLCQSCRDMASSLAEVLSRYPDEVRLVWKHMPNESLHALATPASLAAQCAAKQGKFWEYHDLLYSNQGLLTEASFSEFALRANLDIDDFDTCFEIRDALPMVRKDYEEGLALQLTATPAIFINGNKHIGSIPTEEILTYVRQELDK